MIYKENIFFRKMFIVTDYAALTGNDSYKLLNQGHYEAPSPPPSTPSLLTKYFRRRKMWHIPKYCPNGNGIFPENFKRYVYRKNKKK